MTRMVRARSFLISRAVVLVCATTQSCDGSVFRTLGGDDGVSMRSIRLPSLTAAVLVDPADVAFFDHNCESTGSMEIVVRHDTVSAFGREYAIHGASALSNGGEADVIDIAVAEQLVALVEEHIGRSRHCGALTSIESGPNYYLVRVDADVEFGLLVEVVQVVSRASGRSPLLRSHAGRLRTGSRFGSSIIPATRYYVLQTKDEWATPLPESMRDVTSVDLHVSIDSTMWQVVGGLNAIESAGVDCVVGPWPLPPTSTSSEYLRADGAFPRQLSRVPVPSSPTVDWVSAEMTGLIYAIQLPMAPAHLGPLYVESNDHYPDVLSALYKIELYHTGMCPLMALPDTGRR